MRFAILASGSKGNAALVEHKNHLYLIDCGISYRQLKERMSAVSSSPSDLTHIFLTHEHSDHIKGLIQIVKQTGIKPHMTRGTAYKIGVPSKEYTEVVADNKLHFKDMEVLPFTIPHDAQEAVHYQFEINECKLSFVTDVGRPNEYISNHIKNSNAIVIEANYDPEMLENNPQYPYALKNRIRGGKGHLSNAQAGELLKDAIGPETQLLVAAHLSEKNNNKTVCVNTLKQWIKRCAYAPQIEVAYQHEVTPWFEVT